MAYLSVLTFLGLLAGIGIWWRRARRGPRRALRRAGRLAALVLVSWLVAEVTLLPRIAQRAPAIAEFEMHVPGAALVVLPLCWSAAGRQWIRRPARYASALTAAYVAYTGLGLLLVHANAHALGTEYDDGPTQATGWSCGAAATAYLLREHGLPVSEYDAARLCATRPWLGTTPAGMVAGLARMGIPAVADFRASYTDLLLAPKPCLAVIVILGGVHHVVVVEEADTAKVSVYDPLGGAYWVAREEFELEFAGVLVREAEKGSGTSFASGKGP